MNLTDYIKANPTASDAEILAARNAESIILPPEPYEVTYFLIADDKYFDPDPQVRFQMFATLPAVMEAAIAQGGEMAAAIRVVHERLTSREGMDLSNATVQAGIQQIGSSILAELTDGPAALVQTILAKMRDKGQSMMVSEAMQSTGRPETQADVDAARAELVEEAKAANRSMLRAWWLGLHGDVMAAIEANRFTGVEDLKAMVAGR